MGVKRSLQSGGILLSLLANVLMVLSTATNYWTRQHEGHSGLWQECNHRICSNIPCQSEEARPALMSDGTSDPQGSGHRAGPTARHPPLPSRAQMQLSLLDRGSHEPLPQACGLIPEPLPIPVAAVTAGPDVTSKARSKRLTPGRGSRTPGQVPGGGRSQESFRLRPKPSRLGAVPAGAEAPTLLSHAGRDSGVHGAGGGLRRGGHGVGTVDSVARGRVAAGPDHKRLPLPRRTAAADSLDRLHGEEHVEEQRLLLLVLFFWVAGLTLLNSRG
ncbi:claudin domain-containing protein 2 isoform X1 [Cebus imitator]|uniref:claudin domain-containing protein 2 isoform X1 n=1 Tax=Cebus imitator TaxID=2715852 RepID=UPI00080A6492|nr:claudin domain-containing protein 2 isoform X1 [Cebus imitator]